MNKTLNPLITVIIPTKDRAKYLRHTLRTCAEQDYDNLRVIVADDASTDETADLVSDFHRRDPRIHYRRLPVGSGMLDNFEFALDQAEEGYVIALGGDDGLLPGGVAGMRDALVDTGKELLTWPTPVYIYPGTRAATGQLILPATGGRLRNGLSILESSRTLANQARDLSYVIDGELPMFYVKGVVSTRLINVVRSRTPGRRFYACATPDGYSGIVLAGEVDQYAFSSKPFSIFGASPSSQGLNYLVTSSEAQKRSEEFFRLAESRPMHRELGSQPYSPLISLMTADYLLTARDLPGWPGQFPPIDYKNLLLRSIRELQDGLYGYERVRRELAILYGVAEFHGLGDFFRREVRRKRRNARAPLEGNAFSPLRYYWNACECGIRNLFDASYLAFYAYEAMPKISGAGLLRAAANSLRYKMLSYARGAAFPPESEWVATPATRRTV